ncbi:MAG: IMS domain-containing protein [Waterburya sp.]
MRIPLDYYRILSVPVKATAEQLEQAYRDRLLQQPRREYSETAIEARQQLIEYSYQVLSEADQRAVYDAQFLINMHPLATPASTEAGESATALEVEEIEDETTIPLGNPTIEIPSGQMIGALLILHELGEYETVLKFGIDYFNSQELEQPSTQEDIILTLALAYLELGREQWHRNEYENAAMSTQLGINLLQQQGLFFHIQEELERDLDKLRPYRILELISQNPPQSASRVQGFQLLQSMLLQRQGIEGKGEDRSGLNFDQFLCFVQQLRTYLTSAEQQQLFDDESQKESAIANYLAVYALLGRGFSLRQPELVLRAQRKLDTLSERQDVSWEQAISALLLGHTEKAMYKLQNSQDISKLEQVQQHSVGSSDLLPGLCFYGEQWLKQDVLAQFNDLSATQLTLKEYFADRQVQDYLNELATTVFAKDAAPNSVKQKSSIPNNQPEAETAGVGIMSLWRSIFSREKSELTEPSPLIQVGSTSRELVGVTNARKNLSMFPTTIEGNQSVVAPDGLKSGRSKVPPAYNNHYQNSRSQKSPTLPLQPRAKSRDIPSSVMQKAQSRATRKRVSGRKKPSPATLIKGWLFIFGLIFGVVTMGYVVTKLFLAPDIKTVNQTQLAIAVSQPAIQVPPKKIKPAPAKPKVTFADQSQQLIQTWLNSKSAAFGKKHQIEQLNNILAEPLLTTWRDRAIAYQTENSYREYEHQVTLRSTAINPNDPNKATIEAEVKEVAKHYQSGELDNAQSYDDNLLVRYHLLRQGKKWLINHAEVLKTL